MTALTRLPRPLQALCAAALLHVAFFGVSLWQPPKVDSDAATGMLVWRSMEAGSRWNRMIVPDPRNIASDSQEFLSWWSPGQYLTVGPLHALGLDWGKAISVATFVCAAAGGLGFWRLYLRLGFTPETGAWSAAIVSVTWNVMRNYGEFAGGDLPLFAALPWLVAGLVALKPLGWRSIVPFAALYVCGAMVKLSFCVCAVAVLAGVCWSEFEANRTPRRLGRLAGLAAAMLLTGHGALWAIFLRFGANPSAPGQLVTPLGYLLPALAALPAGSVLGAASALSRLLLFPGHPLVAQTSDIGPYLWPVAAGLALLCFQAARTTRLPRDYGAFVGAVVAAYALVIGTLVFLGASISLEDRQFFPAGALVLPSFVEMARVGTVRIWRGIARGVLAGACAYGVAAAGVHAAQLRSKANVGRSGVTQHIISPEALRLLHRIDDRTPRRSDVLIYLPSPEISLELRRTRFISTFDLSLTARELSRVQRHGIVPLLVVFSNPVLESGGRSEAVLASFADYPRNAWKRRECGEWTLYYQGAWMADVE